MRSRQLRVLFIDDEPSMREVISRYLEEDNHLFDLAADGNEGITKFLTNAYDLVITDWFMPGMPGDQVAEAIKATNSRTPVIMLTGYADTVAADGKPPAGVDMLIRKPVTQNALKLAVEQVMANSSA